MKTGNFMPLCTHTLLLKIKGKTKC